MCIWQYKSRSWQSYSSDGKLARRIESLMTKLDCRFKTVHRERGTCRRQPHVRPLTTVPPSAAIQPGATSSFRQTMHQWSVGKDELNLGFASRTGFRHNIRGQIVGAPTSQCSLQADLDDVARGTTIIFRQLLSCIDAYSASRRNASPADVLREHRF